MPKMSEPVKTTQAERQPWLVFLKKYWNHKQEKTKWKVKCTYLSAPLTATWGKFEPFIKHKTVTKIVHNKAAQK